MAGRGAWAVTGAGGTKKYKDGTKPGPYYFLGTGEKPSGRERTDDEYAVWRAVAAFQAALNRELPNTRLAVDGVLGLATSAAITRYQQANEPVTGTPWGGVGPDTAEALLKPLMRHRLAEGGDTRVTEKMVSGTVRHESLWDPGAVGYLDPTDLGLAQINGPSHPMMTRDDRLNPAFAFDFVISYYAVSLLAFKNNVRDAVASYNLGLGGTRSWIKDGRPSTWTPVGQTRPRDVKGYIDSILKG